MTINIQNASTVNVIGRHNGKNCKAIYNITTGEIYASGLDTATALGVDPGSVSAVLNGRAKTCKGMRLCFVSKMMEHLEEINEANRIRIAKVAAYDADIGRRSAIAKAQEKVDKHKENIKEFNRLLHEEAEMLVEAERELQNLQNNA